ncbi:isocitrate/isopropylmalate dehydrogenase family protein [Arthrobacter sp. GCM10027362]
MVLSAAAERTGVRLELTEYPAGSGLYRDTGESMSEATFAALETADAVLLGAMGIPSVRRPDGTEEGPQVDLRDRFGLFASLRPCRRYPGVPSRVDAPGVDMLVIRETTEGLFAGRHDQAESSPNSASDRMTITRATSEKLFELAFREAPRRRAAGRSPGRVTLLDKANALRSQAFLRSIFLEVATRHPGIESECLYVDAGMMLLVTAPERFDVVVSENIFGDIASEVAAGVVGGLGVAPSGDVSGTRGVFQPSHGSAPDIAGKGLANPVAAILSGAMMLRWLGQRRGDERLLKAAAAIDAAVEATLVRGPRTPDIGGSAGTREVTEAIRAWLDTPTALSQA